MRLQEMYYLIRKSLDNWEDPVFSQYDVSGPREAVFSCNNAKKIIYILEPLRIFPSIQAEIESIYRTSKEFNVEIAPYVSKSGRSSIKSSMAKIHRDLLVMVDMCEVLGVESGRNGFDVKLPSEITLDELADCVKDLNTIFSQCPLFRSDDEQITLHGVDVGSSWLVFTIVGGCALGLGILNSLAALVDKAMVIRSHWITCKQQQESFRKAELSNEHIETMISVHDEYLKKLKEKAVAELVASNDITNPEAQERMRVSFDLLYKWVEKGVEIYNAVGGPDEAKALFPSVEQQTLPENLPKLLEQNIEETE